MTGSISIIAVGDLAPLRPLSSPSQGAKEVWSLMRQADLALANLELPLTHSTAAADKAVTLKADPAVAPSLAEFGIDVVTIANNHAMDYGSEGLLETLSVLGDSGVKAVGGGVDLGRALGCQVVTAGDVKVAVVGFASTLPTGYAAGPSRPGIAPIRAHARFYIDNVTLEEQPGISPWVETTVDEADLTEACKQVAAAKQEADVVIVLIHWGVPNGWAAAFQGPLADYQKPLGHALIDAGADVIVGSHPHTIHGVERHGNGVIAYSVGNFLFHSMGQHDGITLKNAYPPYDLQSLEQGDAREGLVMEILVTGGRVSETRFRPVRMNADGDPEVLHGHEAARVLQRLKRLSDPLETGLEIDGETGTLRLSRA